MRRRPGIANAAARPSARAVGSATGSGQRLRERGGTAVGEVRRVWHRFRAGCGAGRVECAAGPRPSPPPAGAAGVPPRGEAATLVAGGETELVVVGPAVPHEAEATDPRRGGVARLPPHDHEPLHRGERS